MPESISSSSNLIWPRLLSHSAAASPWLPSKPVDLEADIAAAMHWNYAVSIDRDWGAEGELRFTAIFNEALSSGESSLIKDYFRLSIHPSPGFGEPCLQLAGKTSDGKNPAYWPSVRLDEYELWTPDRSLAMQTDFVGEWWVLEHPQRAGLVLEWSGLDLRERWSARLSAQVFENASQPFDYLNPKCSGLGRGSAEVSFQSSIVPQIQRQFEAVEPANTLHETIEHLLRPIACSFTTEGFSLRIQVLYEYEIDRPELFAAVPVLLVPDQHLGQMESSLVSFASDLAAQIDAWRKENQPSTLKARVNFSVSLLGPMDKVSAPLVHFTRIPIKVSNVTADWWR